MSRTQDRPRSSVLWRRARSLLAGGVDSPVRSFRAVGGTPVFFSRGRGAFLVDVDGHRYLDLLSSWGANLLGNAPPGIVRAVRAAARDGLSFGAPTARENELAARLRRRVPALERLRFVTSGTEAVMSAVRVARGFTDRPIVVKFAGGYHGHADSLLVRAGSGLLESGRPDSAGVPRSIASTTRVLPYNDSDAVKTLFESQGERIAAVVVEPVAGNMGVVPPTPGFLRTVSRSARAAGALVVADEVITGFRLRAGTIHECLGLRADLVTLGKVIGGGLPVAAYGGRHEVMDRVAPAGPVYQAGTLAGNPVATAAGIAMLDALTPTVYRTLEHLGGLLEAELRAEAAAVALEPFTVQRVGSMLGLFFAPSPVVDLPTAEATDRGRYARFFHAALERGVYLPPAPLETAFVSAAVTAAALERARPAFRAAFRAAAPGVPS